MELRTPQAKGTVVVRVERDRLAVELPFPVCSSRAGQSICKPGALIQRLRQHVTSPLHPSLEKGLHETLEVLEGFTDNDRLAGFSITMPYVTFTPAEKRAAAAKTLKQALLEAGYEVEVDGSDTEVKPKVAAAA